STFVGGQGWDEGRSLRFTPEGKILVAGYTNSNDFPVTEDALYDNRQAYDEGCVFILSPGGRRLLYSTYIAWNTYEDSWAAYLDDDGVMTVFGLTTSTDLPISEHAFQIQKGDAPESNPYIADFYVLKYRLDSGEILACTYLGGSGSERYPNSLIPLPDGSVFVSGSGNSVDYPLTEGAPLSIPDTYSAKISFLNSDLSELLFSAELGGHGHTHIRGLLILEKNLIFAGLSYAGDFPTTAGSYQEKKRGEIDAFFTILDLSSVLTGIETPADIQKTAVLSSQYPNPAQSETTIPFSLPRAGHIRLAIHDMIGREALSVLDTQLDAGEHQVTVALGHLSPGAYLVRLLTPAGMQSRMLHVF
ncbi:MAG: T9SS type A sorting domain-containing protein, partial [Bacteroidetes bacterium]|nr:T9SS type A sorting domain-containing protein [Bacteroidota bacterium]